MKKIFICLIALTAGISIILPWAAPQSGSVYYKNQVMVLMYHHISDKAQSSSTITPKLFQDQLHYLVDKGYHFISISQFKQFLSGADVPDNAILMTFDDGYESYMLDAIPIMDQLHVPSINFIITSFLKDPHSGYLRYLSDAQIKGMLASSSYSSVGCHTNALHFMLPNGKAALIGNLTLEGGALEPDIAYHKRVVSDIALCRKKIDTFSTANSDVLAYPYGINSTAAISALKEAGIRYSFTLVPEMTTRGVDPMRIPRLNAGSPDITPQMLHHNILQRAESPILAK